MVRAVVYARISSDRDGGRLGTRRQLRDCEQLAESRGWVVTDRYVDDDVSAYSGKQRPEYRRLLADIESGLVDAVVVWHVDRLVRQPRELEQFLDTCDAARITKLASVSGDLDLATHDGRLMARMLGAFARKESDDKSRRIRRKAEELAEAGKVGGGGTRPYGFESDRVTIRESEAEVIREAVTRVLAGESMRSICADFNERQIPTVLGRPWKTNTLHAIVQAPRTSGQREHRGEIVADAVWPAIVSPADTARVRALFADPSRRTNRSARRYLLVRLLRCARCGATLVSRPTTNGVRRYMCANGPNFVGCGKTFAKADTLEAFVVEAVLQRLDSPELAATLDGRSGGDEETQRWQLEVDQTSEELAQLAQDWAERLITRAEWFAARKPIEDRMNAARRRLATLSRSSALTGYVGQSSELRTRWAELPLTRQHAIVAAVLDHVVVGPGRRGYNRFDPTRFQPVWRA